MNRSLFGALMVIALSCSAEPLQDVRWTDAIYPREVSGRAVKQSQFSELLEEGWKEKVRVLARTRGGEKNIVVGSCQEGLRLGVRNMDTEDPLDMQPFTGWMLQCEAMSMLSQMKPFSKAYLELDVARLLAGLSEVELVESGGHFFSGLKKSESITCKKNYSCRVETAEDVYLVRTVGAGDLDGDGVEDLIVISYSAPKKGTATSGGWVGLVISKLQPNEKLRVLRRFGRFQ